MTLTKIATSIAAGSAIDAVNTVLASTQKQLESETPKLLLAFGSTQQPLADVMPKLQEAYGQSVVVGCSSAGEFTQAGEKSGALSLFALAGDHKVFAGFARGLRNNVEAAVGQAVAELPSNIPGYPYRTAILLLDGLCGVAEEAALLTSTMLGEETRMAGGCAGDDLKMQKTLVGFGKQVADDAMVVITIHSKKPCGIGVAHAHKPFSKPVKITRAANNIVHEIDGERAWDVWTRIVKARVPKLELTPATVPPFLAKYEAALAVGNQFKIRAPLGYQEDGSMAFACGIPTGTVIRVAESTPEQQIDSAREAARRARLQIGDQRVAGALVFDCVCRKAILTNQFDEAVRGIASELGSVALAGFETYGEIAADAGDLSGFHNTTTVVLAFPR